MAIIEQSVGNTLGLSQSVLPGGPILLQVVDTLDLSDSALGIPNPQRIGHSLSNPAPGDLDPSELPDVRDPDYDAKMAAVLESHSLRDSVVVRRSITNLSVGHQLTFSDSAANVIELSVGNHLHLGHEVRTNVSEFILEDVLILSDVVLVVVGPHIIDTLELTDSAIGNVDHNISITDTLELKGEAGFYFGPDRNLTTCEVQPTNTGSVTFTFPFTSPVLTVTLRNPDLGNADALNLRRINRRDRGGSLEIFRRDIWPKHQRQRLQFSGMTDAQRRAVYDILNASLGQDVGYLDHEGRLWKGIFTTPASKIQELGRFCDHEVTLEFQGDLQ